MNKFNTSPKHPDKTKYMITLVDSFEPVRATWE